MVNPVKLGAAAVLLIAVNSASAQETPLLDYVLESCATELEEYCSTVTPGDGRLLLCTAAHEDKLSSQCTVALYQASVILQELTNTIAYLAESCATDIDEYCAETPTGEGRLLMCLQDKEGDLTDSCKTAIEENVEME
jgi:Golgi apparatus protein 1